MNHVGRWIELDTPALAQKDDPALRVARIAVARAASFAEQSTARSTPLPPVSCLTWATLSGPETSTLSQRPRSFAIFIRSGTTSMPMIFCRRACGTMPLWQDQPVPDP